ncbi:amylo-alpha-1,6-glucosidase [Methanocella sp. CWC-04]|uniref:Amylo-alpha-1,6-glucosidase n=1 Tax=Methanooceanicella nereidis TaxID=2052831 RepID=A0AAP2RDG0_9EURY|nr:amylo-alpha-1,6-glucosidase [Methanocella sp. CWC-04]MCD1295283.1 amylo-alpha-1,6-glucosidase [Methanocella sp. CWC-04]
MGNRSYDISNSLVIRENDLTLITLPNGDIPVDKDQGYGLYYHDCRFLSGFTLKVNDQQLTNILSSDEKDYASTIMATNHYLIDNNDAEIPENTITIRRERNIPGFLNEKITIKNYNEFEVTLSVQLHFESDFKDIFTVRGIEKGPDGHMLPYECKNGELRLAYSGKDGIIRKTIISFLKEPDSVIECSPEYRLFIPPGKEDEISFIINVNDGSGNDENIINDDLVKKRIDNIRESYHNMRSLCKDFQTDNQIFNSVFKRCMADLRLLNMSIEGQVFYSGGIPWYDTLFGRDSIISAIQSMPYEFNIAKSTLRLLALYRGKCLDDWRDEEPGKILHELRRGEKSRLNRIPNTPYYGSADSTPLYLILLSEYINWTGDTGILYELIETIESAITWMDKYSDMKDLGFASYYCRSEKGLYNQSWKDSFDSISRKDGTIAKAPIATVELQGYMYLAKKRISKLFKQIGRKHDAIRLEKDAEKLKKDFNRSFWVKENDYYALAIDKEGICEVTASNPAQCLWCGIVEGRKAERIVNRIFQEDMFSGWGIRTMSSHEKRYNPLGYHNGTIWPHDNSIIAMGLSKYGFKNEALTLFNGLFEAASFQPRYRLPELFGGYEREKYSIPTKYPVACSPQAWSSGSIPYMLISSLGLVPDALNNSLSMIKPELPVWLDHVKINNLKVGKAMTDLEFKKVNDSTFVNVIGKKGELDIHVYY